MVSKALKKRDAIIAITQVVNIPKYSVLDHETIPIMKRLSEDWCIPKGTTDIAVIYLKK